MSGLYLFRDEMKRLTTLLLIVSFLVQIAGVSYALRPIASMDSHSFATLEEAIVGIRERDFTDEQIYGLRKGFIVDADSEHQLFSRLVLDHPRELPMVQISLQGENPEIKEKLGRLSAKALELGLDGGKIVGIAESCIVTIHRWVPPHLFKRFYTDTCIIAAHALTHALDDIYYCLEIIKNDPEINVDDIDITSLCYAAIFHDIACILHRERHETNSITWMRTILEKEKSFSTEQIDKIEGILDGHWKITEVEKRPGHRKYAEARVFHDADTFSAIFNLDRIYNLWKNWSIEESKAKGKLVNKLFIPDIPMAARLEALTRGHFWKADAATDIAKHVWVRRNPEFFLTEGGRIIVKEAGRDMNTVIEFIEAKRQDITSYYQLSGGDIAAMYIMLEDLHSALKKAVAARSEVRLGRKSATISSAINSAA